jgi:NAD(P)-dependent dehydrogenase (short-subunit alcohol dehydrogenase family)
LLKDKVALVTGGGSGIGRATSIAYAREGAKVAVSDIAEEGGEETVRMIKETGGEALFIKADVSKAQDIERLIKQTLDAYQDLNCACNNAGIGSPPGTLACTEEDWDRTMNVNLKGVWLCMKNEIPHMLNNGGGSIVNVSSFAGLAASKVGIVAYSASKHGVIGLTKTSAVEFAGQGIRINAVCPGATRTPILERFISDPAAEARIASNNPMNRIASPDEVAEAIVWLSSDAASFVTGIAMPVDGGQVL